MHTYDSDWFCEWRSSSGPKLIFRTFLSCFATFCFFLSCVPNPCGVYHRDSPSILSNSVLFWARYQAPRVTTIASNREWCTFTVITCLRITHVYRGIMLTITQARQKRLWSEHSMLRYASRWRRFFLAVLRHRSRSAAYFCAKSCRNQRVTREENNRKKAAFDVNFLWASTLKPSRDGVLLVEPPRVCAFSK